MNAPARHPTRSTSRYFAQGLARCRSTVIFFGVDERVVHACAPVARELRIARAETSHLHAACSALEAFPGAMLVISTAIRHSERDAIEQHAARANAVVVWVGFEDDAADVVSTIRSWVAAALPALARA